MVDFLIHHHRYIPGVLCISPVPDVSEVIYSRYSRIVYFRFIIALFYQEKNMKILILPRFGSGYTRDILQ